MPSGTGFPQNPGAPPLPGAIGMTPPGAIGSYLCIDGTWYLISVTPTFPFAMEGGPSVSVVDAAVTADEGTTATNLGSFSYAGSGAVSLSASVGTVTAAPGGTWLWSYAATDGPVQSQTVVISAVADGKFGAAAFDLTVDNVAPQVVSVAPTTTTALVGQPVSFVGSATDPSTADTAAGFSWAFNGTPVSGSSFTTSFSDCGSATVTATATDKDGASSAPVTSMAVNLVEARFMPPLRAGENIVRSGQVVPVKVEIGCHGVPAGGVAPTIELLGGGAGGTAVMRPVGDGYLYNLSVPEVPAGTLLTVRVHPFGGSGAVDALLRTRG